MASQESQQASQTNRENSTGNQAFVKDHAAAYFGDNATHYHHAPNIVEKPISDSPKIILLLSANPQNSRSWTRSKENLEEIEKALNKATKYYIEKEKTQSAFAFLEDKLRTEASEISQILLAKTPYIIDIFGFEDGLANLALEEDFQSKQSKDSDFLIGEMFEISSPTTKCTVLNGCYLEAQAREIVQHVDYLIGINQSISIDATLLFLNDFYFYIGLGIPIVRAYKAGRNRVLRRGLDDTQVPILLLKTEEISRRNREQRLSVLAEEIEEAPDNAEKRIERGDLLEESGKHEKAALAYSEALRINGENYKALWKYGIAQTNAGNYVEAKEAYDNALSLHIPFSDAYIIRREHGSILAKIKEFKRSLASYKESLQIEPRYRVSGYEKRKIYKKLYQKAR